MISLLIAIIYLSFISLGLGGFEPLLGAAWPVMQIEMNVPLSFAGIVSMIITASTIVSSLLSNKLTKRFGAGGITFVSALLTALALFGFSVSTSFWMLCLWAIPYGLSCGAIDAALNNYVALHFASRHMNWLHGFWGVGAASGPYIMGYCLAYSMGWSSGYRIVSLIQVVLAVLLFLSLPLWKKPKKINTDNTDAQSGLDLNLSQILKIKGVKLILFAFFCYCALESTVGLWASSYLVLYRGTSAETAANYGAFFFIGLTIGRFLSGFISDKTGNKNMIRLGIGIMLFGIILVCLPVKTDWLCLKGLIIVGLGCAPVFPAVIHSTPANFGKENSQSIVGVQMASAYMGAAFMPFVFGLIASKLSIGLMPVYLFIMAVLMLFMTEKLNKVVRGS